MATKKPVKKAAPAMKSAGKKKAAAKFDGKSLKGSNKKEPGAGG